MFSVLHDDSITLGTRQWVQHVHQLICFHKGKLLFNVDNAGKLHTLKQEVKQQQETQYGLTDQKAKSSTYSMEQNLSIGIVKCVHIICNWTCACRAETVGFEVYEVSTRSLNLRLALCARQPLPFSQKALCRYVPKGVIP